MRYPESRHERRVAKREEARQKAEERLAAKMARLEPRSGEDRRRQERRSTQMTPDEVSDWLKRNGITTGDRRHNDRRQGDRRR